MGGGILCNLDEPEEGPTNSSNKSTSLTKEALSSFETLVHTYETTRRHLPLSGINRDTCRENIKFQPNFQINKPRRKTKTRSLTTGKFLKTEQKFKVSFNPMLIYLR
jgi:hypothetical protein